MLTLPPVPMFSATSLHPLAPPLWLKAPLSAICCAQLRAYASRLPDRARPPTPAELRAELILLRNEDSADPEKLPDGAIVVVVVEVLVVVVGGRVVVGVVVVVEVVTESDVVVVLDPDETVVVVSAGIVVGVDDGGVVDVEDESDAAIVVVEASIVDGEPAATMDIALFLPLASNGVPGSSWPVATEATTSERSIIGADSEVQPKTTKKNTAARAKRWDDKSGIFRAGGRTRQ